MATTMTHSHPYTVLHRYRSGHVREEHFETEAEALAAAKTSTASLASVHHLGHPVYTRSRDGTEWGAGRHVTLDVGYPAGRRRP